MHNGITYSDLELLVGLVAQLQPEEYPDPYVGRLIRYCQFLWQSRSEIRLNLHGN